MAGQYFDAETGLHYNYHRYYDPSIGRYLRPDPLDLEAGINLYSYTLNNPINYTDPTGNIAVTGTIALIWAGVELGLSIYDAWDTGLTLLDSCASDKEKAVAVGIFAVGVVLPGGGYSAIDDIGRLSSKQLKNLKRFNKKLPSNAGPTRIKDLPGGGKAFQADSPAANIPGSYATYEKQIDSAGNTLNYTKTTYAPDGSIVNVKQKYP